MSLQEQRFQAIANAIRSKTGKTDPIKAVNFAEEILTIGINNEETWENINLNDKTKLNMPDFKYYYFHSNNVDLYGSYNDSNKSGIYHINIITGEKTQIYSNGYNWCNFFEDSNGNVYMSNSDNAVNGIFKLSGTTATQIYSNGCSWCYFFEDNNGNVYAGSTMTNTGIICISNSTATQIYSDGYSWCYFFEDSNGNVYTSSNNTGSGGNSGIILIKDSTATKIFSGSIINWQFYFESSNGNLYVGTSSKGIVCISNSTATLIQSTGYIWRYFFEDSKGNVYASSGSSNAESVGLLQLFDNSAKLIYSNDYNWCNFFEDSNGNVYVSGGTGLLKINDVATQIYANGNKWEYFTERLEGIIVSKTEKPNGDEFLLIENEQVYLVRGE